VLIYSGPSQETGMTVSSTNGIASTMNTLLTSATTANTGLIATDLQAISTQATATQKQIDNVNAQIGTTRQQLLAKFSALESAIAKANSALNYLNAQQVAQSH
jgi:flagellar capping protein FliD